MLTNFQYMFTNGRMHRQPQNRMPPAATRQWGHNNIEINNQHYNKIAHEMNTKLLPTGSH